MNNTTKYLLIAIVAHILYMKNKEEKEHLAGLIGVDRTGFWL